MLASIVRAAAMAFVILLAAASAPAARADLLPDFQAALYAGHTDAAITIARDRLAATPGDDQARFALGAAQFLRAIERLGQGLHRYGLQSEYRNRVGLLSLPILRLPIPENLHPEKVSYAAFRALLGDFVDDLKTAEATLAPIGEGGFALPLDLARVRLDLRGDGAASQEETLFALFARVSGYPGVSAPGGALSTDFDQADAPWLRGYCNLLMAIVEIPLGYDFHETFDWSFQAVFADGDFAARALAVRDRAVRDELAAIGPEPPYFQFDRKQLAEKGYDEAYQEWRASPEGQANARWSQLQNYAFIAEIADLVAALHVTHWPVAEPARLESALGHLQAMVALSRENWRRIEADANPGKRWIPKPGQVGVLPNMRVTPERVAAWKAFLDGFDAVLQGKTLVPHWRFDKGVNLRRVFLEPRAFDPVMLAQGDGALPYLEDGAQMTQAETRLMLRAFEGDFFRYFLWFN